MQGITLKELYIIVIYKVITTIVVITQSCKTLYIIVIYKVITTKGNKWVSFQELYIIVIYKVITTDVILSQQSVIIVYNSNL